MSAEPNLIVMLTCNDVIVTAAREVFASWRNLPLSHWDSLAKGIKRFTVLGSSLVVLSLVLTASGKAKGPLLEADENGRAFLTDAGKAAFGDRPIEGVRTDTGWGTKPLGRPCTLKVPTDFRNRPTFVDEIRRPDGLVLFAPGKKVKIAVGDDQAVRRLGEEIEWHLSEMCGEMFDVVPRAGKSRGSTPPT